MERGHSESASHLCSRSLSDDDGNCGVSESKQGVFASPSVPKYREDIQGPQVEDFAEHLNLNKCK